jgi:hypothetical protein
VGAGAGKGGWYKKTHALGDLDLPKNKGPPHWPSYPVDAGCAGASGKPGKCFVCSLPSSSQLGSAFISRAFHTHPFGVGCCGKASPTPSQAYPVLVTPSWLHNRAPLVFGPSRSRGVIGKGVDKGKRAKSDPTTTRQPTGVRSKQRRRL